jgi:hypothetical protein
VHDAGGVRRADGMSELLEDVKHLGQRQGSDAADVRREILAAEQLHREPRGPRRRVDARRHDLHDVLALDPCADARLLLEALAELRIRHELRVHELERALLLRADLLGDVDRAHAARGQRAHDAKVAREGRAGGEVREAGRGHGAHTLAVTVSDQF